MNTENPAAPSKSITAAIDTGVLEELKAELLDIAPELVAELMTYYINNTPAFLAELRQALDATDAERVTRKAHQLKANSARLGATECSALCQKLEFAGEKNDLDDASAMIDQLEAEFKRVEVVFKQMLQA